MQLKLLLRSDPSKPSQYCSPSGEASIEQKRAELRSKLRTGPYEVAPRNGVTRYFARGELTLTWACAAEVLASFCTSFAA